MKFEAPECQRGMSGRVVYTPRVEDAELEMYETFERVRLFVLIEAFSSHDVCERIKFYALLCSRLIMFKYM